MEEASNVPSTYLRTFPQLISLSVIFNSLKELNDVSRLLPNLSVYRSSSILRPSISGLLSPIQEPSDSEIALEEIGKMNGVSVYRCLNRCTVLDFQN